MMMVDKEHMMKMMTSPLRACALALALAGFTGGAMHAQPVGAPDASYAEIDADPAIWLLEDEDTRLYLFGTVHLLPATLDWRTEAFQTAFAEADTLWLEADVVSEQAQAQMGALLPRYGFNPAGVTLSSLLSEDAIAVLSAEGPKLGLAPAAMEGLQPWLASVTIAVSQITALGYDPNSGVDQVLARDAAETGMAFAYFETVEDQFSAFASVPLEAQARDMERGLADLQAGPEIINRIVRAWAVGDMDELDAAINVEMREQSPETYQAIMVERNHNWIPHIIAALAEPGVAFMAVGAGHMPGEEGVIALLEAEGYAVSRLNPQP
ncbi:MAG: TraB/GumN family protein [Pseudomonadota bacterium]